MSITGGQDNFEEDSKMNCLWKEKETERKKNPKSKTLHAYQ